ncbi:hypothetical protein DOTSEDRAFT_98043, partial [Dothistroma septosporum NZE10]
NLFEGLRRLRHKTVVSYLWVGAICTNQEDLQERNQQVGMTSRIFQSAARVDISLG